MDKALVQMSDKELVDRVLGSKFKHSMDPLLLEIAKRLSVVLYKSSIEVGSSSDDHRNETA